MAAVTAREETGIREYCDTVYKNLSDMKAKAFDIICRVEQMPVEERQRFRVRYSEFFDLVDYIERKLDSLIRECPLDWTSLKDEIEGRKKMLTGAVDLWDTEHIAGGYVGG